MLDLLHWYGTDLQASATGDLATIGANANELTIKGQQRVLRRLLTNPGDYIWHPDYGAGLPRYVGASMDTALIEGVIRSQIYAEAVVARDPAPEILVQPFTNLQGLQVSISYVDARNGEPVELTFSVP